MLLADFNIRIVAILITVFLTLTVKNYSIWFEGVLALGFLHYFLSIYYAKGKTLEILSNKNRFIPLFSLIAFSFVLLFIRFPLEIYFAVHHAFNEGFLSKYSKDSSFNLGSSIFNSKSLVHFFAYLFILRHESIISRIPVWFLAATLLLSYIYYFYALKDSSAGKTFKDKLKIVSFDIFILVPVIASFFIKITFLQIVLYHFVLWAILPVKPLLQKSREHLIRYAGLSIAIFGLIAIFSFRELSPYALSPETLYEQFYLWSYIHITSSLALSSAHPDWIIKLFRPKSVNS